MRINYYLITFLLFSNNLFSNFDLSDSLKIQRLFEQSDNLWNPNGPFTQNIVLLNHAEELSNKIGDYENQVKALLKLATVHFYNSDVLRFEIVNIKADSLVKVHAEINNEYLTYIYANYSSIYRRKRMYLKAIDYCERGIEIAAKLKSPALASLYNDIAKHYISLGDYVKGRDYIELALTANKNPYKAFVEFDSYSELAVIHKRMGFQYVSLENLIRSLEILENQNEPEYIDEIQLYQVAITRDALVLNELELVEKYLEKIEKHSRPFRTQIIEAKYIELLALLEMKSSNKDLNSIRENVDNATKILESLQTSGISLDVSICEIYERLSDFYESQNMLDNSEKYLNKGLVKLGNLNLLDNPRKVKNKDLTVRLLNKLIDVKIANGDKESTEKMMVDILNIIRAFRIENTTASHKQFWANQYLSIIEKAIDFYYSEGDLEACYSLIEENKSNLLAQEINESDSKGYANLPPELLESEKELKQELNFLESEIESFSENAVQDSSVLNNLRLEKSNKQIELDRLNKKLENEYPQYYKLKYDLTPTTIDDVQKLITGVEVVVEYFIGKENAYVVFITKDSYRIEKLKDLKSLKVRLSQFYKSMRSEEDEAQDSLYTLLGLEILDSLSSDINSLIIVGDDVLNNIPFGAIKDNENKLLLERYNIQYQYSIKLMKLLQARKSADYSNDFLGYAYKSDSGVYLPERSCMSTSLGNLACSKNEIDGISNLLADGNNVVIDGSLEDFMDKASNSKIIHLATHACMDAENPDFSRIYFNDDYLTVNDLEVSELNSDLVVLSACESGYGEVVQGEGTMSLSKGFFHAGAKSTVVSLWPVDDCRTAELMNYFYASLMKGNSKDKALREAKLTYLSKANPEKTHPYYWAGFVLIGDSSAVIDSYSSLYLVFIGVLLLVFVAWIIKNYLRKNS